MYRAHYSSDTTTPVAPILMKFRQPLFHQYHHLRGANLIVPSAQHTLQSSQKNIQIKMQTDPKKHEPGVIDNYIQENVTFYER